MDSSQLRIGRGLLARLGDLVGPGELFVVTDAEVDARHGTRLAEALGDRLLGVEAVPPGEASKSMRTLERVLDSLIASGLDRSGRVVACGGGVVGDLAGFAAAVYLRGVGVVQVPTTLLAMVDSAIGGKTGVNHPAGKNLVGAFHQPDLVVADVDLLATLPPRQLACGLAEVVKYALIEGGEILEMVEEDLDRYLRPDEPSYPDLVEKCARAKLRVVVSDVRESGARLALNFGHTLGHALEAAAGYGTLTHGEAIAAGMHAAVRLSLEAGLLPGDQAKRALALIERLPGAGRAGEVETARLVEALSRDKKRRAAALRWVLLAGFGKPVVCEGVDVERAVALLAEAMRALGAGRVVPCAPRSFRSNDTE